MAEIRSLIKSIIFTLLFISILQVRVGALTIEDHVGEWYYNSWISKYVDEVAHGGAAFLKNAYVVTAAFVSKTVGSSLSSEAQKASRLNIDLKRSTQAGQ